MHSLFTTSHPCKLWRRALAPSLVLLAIVGIACTSSAATTPSEAPRETNTGRETVLRGEVVENGCFVIGGRRGEGHLNCALTCAQAGENLGLLDEQTKLLFVVIPDLTAGAQPNPLLPYLAQRVEIRGSTVERGGINGVIVRQVKSFAPPAKH